MLYKITKTVILTLLLVTSLKAVDTNRYFIGTSIGYSFMSVKQNDITGSMILGTKPDDTGVNLNLELGYNFTEDTFFTIGLNHQRYNDIKLYNYLVSYNLRLKNISYNPYIGIVGGISYIELTRGHINSPLLDTKGKEFAIGAQVGFEYPLKNNFLLYGQYQLLKAEHKTSLESTPAKSELIRDWYNNLSIGVRWKF